MDPFTAFSLACGVIQVVDFSMELLSKSREIYKKGSLDEHNEIQSMANHLTNLRADLNLPINAPNPQYTQQLFDDEKTLEDLALKCSETSHELITELHSLQIQGPHRKRKALARSVKAMSKKGTIEDIQKKLNQYQKTLDTRILVNLRSVPPRPVTFLILSICQAVHERGDCIQIMATDFLANSFHHCSRQQINLVSIQQGEVFRRLDIRVQNLVVGLTKEENGFQELKEQLRKESTFINEHISEHFQRHREELASNEFQKQLLDSLYFPEIKARQEEIAEAHKSTFQWIFHDAGQRAHRWSNFVQWLESGHGIYWVSGKAGSGKSTLMNYICEDPRTLRSLEVWSGTTDVLTPTFFFWNPGSAMQKSSIGLLRSLVYQILEAFPHLIPMLTDSGMSEALSEPIAPAKYRLRKISAWTERRLQMTLRRIIRELTTTRVCFFVDGLDEFTGNYSALIELIEDLIQNPNVKACVSSRPYRSFEDAFGGFPKLRLQDLTEQDIRTYATDRLSSLPRTKLLVAGHTKWIPETVHELLRKAEGVFLWVRLAVDDQIEGVKDEDSLEQLAERLQLLPSEMEDLYVHILNKISKGHRKEAVRYLQLVLHWKSDFQTLPFTDRGPNPSLPLIALAEYNKLDDLLCMTSEINIPDMIAHYDRTAKRIATTCAGFLEITSTSVSDEQNHSASTKSESGFSESQNFDVRFLHRTTTKFLLEDERGKRFLDVNSTMSFNPDTSYIKAGLGILIELISRQRELDRSIGDDIDMYIRNIMYTSLLAEEKTGVAQTALMDLVDNTIENLFKHYGNGDSTVHWCTRWIKRIYFYTDRKGNFLGYLRETFQPDEKFVPRKIPSSGLTPTSPVDFLGYAAANGLLLYVQQKLETGHDLSHRYTASYLLCCLIGARFSVSDLAATEYRLRELELIATLLKGEGGVDPNTVAFDGTIWVQVLRRIHRMSCPHGPLREAWIKVITAFLDNDANVQEKVGISKGPLHCQSVFDKSFPGKTFAVASLVSRTGIKPQNFSFETKFQISAMSVIEQFLGHGPGLEEIQSIFIAKGASSYSKHVLRIVFGDECPEELYALSQQQWDHLHGAVQVRDYGPRDSRDSREQAFLILGRVIKELHKELKTQPMEPGNFSDAFSDDSSDDDNDDDDDDEKEEEKEEDDDHDAHDNKDSPDDNESIYYSVPSSPKH